MDPNIRRRTRDNIVREISETTPKLRERTLMGGVRSRNIRTQRRRVRDSLKRIDPIETTLRWRPVTYQGKCLI